jgi:hypothetical protein
MLKSQNMIFIHRMANLNLHYRMVCKVWPEYLLSSDFLNAHVCKILIFLNTSYGIQRLNTKKNSIYGILY